MLEAKDASLSQQKMTWASFDSSMFVLLQHLECNVLNDIYGQIRSHTTKKGDNVVKFLSVHIMIKK